MLGLNLALGVAMPGQQSLLSRALSAIRRNGGTLIGIPDNFAGTYIDSTGTQPVTAVGDVIGNLNDRVGTNNATQPTTASKPSVTLVPKRTKGPVNQLLWSQWSGAGTAPTGWFAFGTGGALGAMLPTGMYQRVFTSTASRDFIYAVHALAANTVYTVAVYVGANPNGINAQEILGQGGIPAGSGLVVPSAIPADGSFILATLTTAATAGNLTLRAGLGAISSQTGSVTLSTPAIFTGTVTAQQILDDGGIPLTTTQPLPNVLEWSNAISFDGSNDFLQTGITTGNEGWICAGVTFGGAAGAIETIAGSGANAPTTKGVWLARVGSVTENTLWLATGNGTTRHVSAKTDVALRNVPHVIDGGWGASTCFVSVDGAATTAATRNGDMTGPSPMQVGAVGGASPIKGPMTAIIYTPVLPSAADRALIRKWVGSLQGQTL